MTNLREFLVYNVDDNVFHELSNISPVVLFVSFNSAVFFVFPVYSNDNDEVLLRHQDISDCDKSKLFGKNNCVNELLFAKRYLNDVTLEFINEAGIVKYRKPLYPNTSQQEVTSGPTSNSGGNIILSQLTIWANSPSIPVLLADFAVNFNGRFNKPRKPQQ
jgi:hypothetical protein